MFVAFPKDIHEHGSKHHAEECWGQYTALFDAVGDKYYNISSDAALVLRLTAIKQRQTNRVKEEEKEIILHLCLRSIKGRAVLNSFPTTCVVLPDDTHVKLGYNRD